MVIKMGSTELTPDINMESSNKAEVFQCTLCPKKLKSQLNLKFHLVIHGNIRRLKHSLFPKKFGLKRNVSVCTAMYNPTKYSCAQRYVCQFCRTSFKYKSNMIEHIISHEGIKPFKCLICFKKFDNPNSLKRHLLLHVNKKTFKCSLCAERFNLKSKLKTHATFHRLQENSNAEKCVSDVSENNLKTRSCFVLIERLSTLRDKTESIQSPVGSSNFDNKSLLNQDHIETQDSEREYVCHIFSKAFSNQNSLNRHLLAHDKSRSFQCPHCTANFKRKTELDEHLLRHENLRNFQCTLCPKRFSQSKHLKLHMKTHSGDKNRDNFGNIWHLCLVCKKTFQNKSALKNHFKIHDKTGALECQSCSLKFKDIDSLKEHVFMQKCGLGVLTETQKSERKYSCQFCSKSFFAQHSLDKHLISHDDARPFQCAFCTSNFKRKSDLNEHMRKHENKRNFYCTLCTSRFNCRSSLQHHMNAHSEESSVNHSDIVHTCDVCKKTFQNKSALKNHFKIHDKTSALGCQSCSLKFIEEDNLKEHLLTHKCGLGVPAETQNSQRKYSCQFCSKAFFEKNSLDKHLVTHDDARPFQCTFCTSNFKRKSDLTEHLRKHENKLNFHCTFCPKRFNYRSNLWQHLKTHGSKEISRCDIVHTCDVCKETFQNKSALTNHYKSHDNAGPFECQPCSLKFKDKDDLRKHVSLQKCSLKVLSETQTSKREYFCHICSKAFFKKYSLIKHLAIHDEARPFQCEKCASNYKRKSDLDDHMRKHEDIRNYPCTLCARKFNFRSSLWQHMKSHSGKESGVDCSDDKHVCDVCKKTFLNKSALKNHLRSHDRTRTFECQTCLSKFKFAHNLEKHMVTHTHSDIFVSCDVCKKSFKTKSKLIRHLKRHSNVKSFQCALCQARFYERCDVWKHLRNYCKKKVSKNVNYVCEENILCDNTWNLEMKNPKNNSCKAEPLGKNVKFDARPVLIPTRKEKAIKIVTSPEEMILCDASNVTHLLKENSIQKESSRGIVCSTEQLAADSSIHDILKVENSSENFVSCGISKEVTHFHDENFEVKKSEENSLSDASVETNFSPVEKPSELESCLEKNSFLHESGVAFHSSNQTVLKVRNSYEIINFCDTALNEAIDCLKETHCGKKNDCENLLIVPD